jgi:hypothetical protein
MTAINHGHGIGQGEATADMPAARRPVGERRQHFLS